MTYTLYEGRVDYRYEKILAVIFLLLGLACAFLFMTTRLNAEGLPGTVDNSGTGWQSFLAGSTARQFQEQSVLTPQTPPAPPTPTAQVQASAVSSDSSPSATMPTASTNPVKKSETKPKSATKQTLRTDTSGMYSNY